METILIVDDEKNYPLIISALLEEEGFETLTANSGEEALEILKSYDVDLILTDMKMPSMDGIMLIERIKENNFNMPVLMMTAYGTVEKAVEAMKKGAYNYILKPFDNDSLIAYVNKALEMQRIINQNLRLLSDAKSKYSFDNIIGKSKAMQNLFNIIRKVAPTNASVLIEGESGTGKELVARSIHFNSARADKSFIPVNCAALSENLLESELFGHEKGAFTGAIIQKKGKFELADNGTIFFDELAEIPFNTQVKLLRILQEKTFERVGGTKSINIDARIIAATNKKLTEEMEAGRFRADLFYRLNVVRLTLPPLRERKEDLGLLINYFIKKYKEINNKGADVAGIDSEVERIFYNYGWPGNIRELENTIEHALIFSIGSLITKADLPNSFKKISGNALRINDIPSNAGLAKTLEAVEKKMIIRALNLSGNVQTRAAEMLKIGKSGLNQKIKKYSLDKNLNF
ncbi:MAG: sigma-54-dependent Fis family transcriptional regulator [Deltaproteobacteria bacterium]|nr:sigma-54-dependent Fis family transcriptional regulator [Deltaproteobacteria bacterium]